MKVLLKNIKNNLEKLSSKELFLKQREAFKNDNILLVKEIVQIARKRLKKDMIGDWEEAKKLVDKMKFPDEKLGIFRFKGEKHNNHDLESYKIYLPRVLGYEVIAYYNYCPTCQKVRNKSIVIFNMEKRTCYQRWLLKKGKVNKFIVS